MPALLLLTAAGFSGYAVRLPVAPLWAVRGGADEAGAVLASLLVAAAISLATLPLAIVRGRPPTGRRPHRRH